MGLFRNVIGEVKKATKKASTKLVRRLYKQLEGPEFDELNPKQRLQWDLYERGLLRREQLSVSLKASHSNANVT
jgi:hypothetical protein